MTAALREMPNLEYLIFEKCFKTHLKIPNNIFHGLKRRKKSLKLLEIKDSLLNSDSYYSLTSLFQAELCTTKVVFNGTIFENEIDTLAKQKKLHGDIQSSTKVEEIPIFNLMVKLLWHKLQILDLNCDDSHIYGVET